MSANLSKAEVMRTLNFCMGALASSDDPENEALLQNMHALAIGDSGDQSDEKYKSVVKEAEAVLTAEQLEYLNSIRKSKPWVTTDDIINLDSTGFDVLDGFSANLVKGQLGLVQPEGLQVN